MSYLIDSSVWVSAMVEDENWHSQSSDLMDRPDCKVYVHAVSEVFSTLTGGRKGFRMPPNLVIQLLKEDYLPCVEIISMEISEILESFSECQGRGITGGAIYDYLHLVAARMHNVEVLYTLNLSHFRAFWRPGDPEIRHPEQG